MGPKCYGKSFIFVNTLLVRHRPFRQRFVTVSNITDTAVCLLSPECFLTPKKPVKCDVIGKGIFL